MKESIKVKDRKDFNCQFVMYGQEEKRCLKCGFIIWVDDNGDDYKAFKSVCESTHEVPNCQNQ